MLVFTILLHFGLHLTHLISRWKGQTWRTDPDLPRQDQSRSNKAGGPQSIGYVPVDHPQVSPWRGMTFTLVASSPHMFFLCLAHQ